MKQPNQEVIVEAERVAKHHPRLRQYLVEWYNAELEALPRAIHNMALHQGRCQVLSELNRLINPDPSSLQAKPVRTPASTHTDRSV